MGHAGHVAVGVVAGQLDPPAGAVVGVAFDRRAAAVDLDQPTPGVPLLGVGRARVAAGLQARHVAGRVALAGGRRATAGAKLRWRLL